MRDDKKIPLTQQLGQLAAEFINTNSNKTSLITVTNTMLEKNMGKVVFFVSVFPPESAGAAVGFLMRNRGECKAYIKQHSNMKKIPHVEFMLDTGEKNRQRVDELLFE